MTEKVQTIKEIHHNISQMFGELYPANEAASIASIIIEEFTALGRIRQMISGDRSLSPAEEKNILSSSLKIAAGEPLQYVLGYSIFCGHRFNVSPAVLIPRPETEEMTSLIINENPGFNGTITDYCTGSGCIAVSLALAFPDAKIHATDISPEAVSVARHNATENKATVTLSIADLLYPEMKELTLSDIIVSNPPYVRESEKKMMRVNVLAHEPHIALFVNDNDPLVFYRRLAEISSLTLSPQGKVYLEINEALGSETSALFKQGGFKNIRIIKDLSGKDRILTAQRDGRKE
jgi:release factor glutamine methyltransferase